MANETTQLTGEVYPNAPLRAVAIEFYFGHLLDAHSRFGAFQRKHGSLFPRVMATGETRDVRDAILLIDDKRTCGVAIAPSMFSVISYRYGGFRAFRDWAAPFILEGLNLLEIPRLTSMTYRYENIIDFDKNDTNIESILQLNLPRASGANPMGRELVMGWTQPWPDGEVTVDIGSFGDTFNHMHLDISARCRGALDVAKVLDSMEHAHKMARLTFEELITPSFRERLRRPTS